MARTIRIRGVDDTTHAALCARADAERLSLSAYLKRELVRSADSRACRMGALHLHCMHGEDHPAP